MADFQVDLDKLLEECQRKLPVADFAVLQHNRQKLLDNQLVTPSIVRALSYEQLCATSLSPGAAAALKAAFPSAAPAAAAGQPKFYHDIKLALFGRDGEEEVKTYDIVTRLNLQKVLDRRGCDAVQDPRSMAWVDFAAIQLQDGMLLRARSDFFPIDLRLATVEGFLETSVKAFEEEAVEAMLRDMRLKHNSSAEILPVRQIASSSGQKREINGAVVTADCAAILEAKQVLDEEAVPQLTSALEFIETQQLTGRAAELKGKKLVGYLAGRTITGNPNKSRALLKQCKQHSYPILVTSGMALSAGNSRIPKLKVNCTLSCRPGLGWASHLLRTLL